MTLFEKLQIRDALANNPLSRPATRKQQQYEGHREDMLMMEAENHLMREYLILKEQVQSLAGSRPPNASGMANLGGGGQTGSTLKNLEPARD